MSLLSKLFGSGGGAAASDAESETYEGFTITPAPMKESGGYRISATIEKDGKTHKLIRADTIGDRDEAIAASAAKARQLIDEQGDRLFG